MSGSLSQRRRGTAPLPKEARPRKGFPKPPSEARVNRTRLAPHRPATKVLLFSSLSPPPLPGRPSQEPLQRGPARSPGQPSGRANRKRKLGSLARAGGWGTAVTAGSRGAEKLEEPSPSSHLEARRFWSVAFRYPGEPVLSLPPPYICESKSFTPRLQSDLRSLLQRSGSLFRSADPAGRPGLVGGLRERTASVSASPGDPQG